MAIEAEPVPWEELKPMDTVERWRRYFQVSDHSMRKWLKDNDLYLRIGGNIRVPKEGVRQILFNDSDETNTSDNVVGFPGTESSD